MTTATSSAAFVNNIIFKNPSYHPDCGCSRCGKKNGYFAMFFLSGRERNVGIGTPDAAYQLDLLRPTVQALPRRRHQPARLLLDEFHTWALLPLLRSHCDFAGAA